MSFTFIKAQGGSIGDSICEDDKMNLALKILKSAKEKMFKFIFLSMFWQQTILAIQPIHKWSISQAFQSIGKDWIVGQKLKAIFYDVVQQCKTILWNGPLGVFELETFSTGTKALGDSIAEATKKGAFSLVGGGDSVAAVKQFGFENKVSYVSTGGGAMLESLEGKTLPGIAAING